MTPEALRQVTAAPKARIAREKDVPHDGKELPKVEGVKPDISDLTFEESQRRRD